MQAVRLFMNTTYGRTSQRSSSFHASRLERTAFAMTRAFVHRLSTNIVVTRHNAIRSARLSELPSKVRARLWCT